MAKLPALIDCLARELSAPTKSVNVLAMELRKVGLIRSTGRGLHAAEMGPSEATNLLLAAIGGGYVTRAANRVSDLRRAAPHKWLRRDSDGVRYVPDGPPLSFARRLPPKHQLGEMLDSIFAEYAAQGSLSSDDDPSETFFKFTINRSITLTLLKLQLGLDGQSYEIDYYDVSSEGDVSYRIRRSRHREVNDRIDGSAFAAIGACLAGRDYVPRRPAEFLDALATRSVA